MRNCGGRGARASRNRRSACDQPTSPPDASSGMVASLVRRGDSRRRRRDTHLTLDRRRLSALLPRGREAVFVALTSATLLSASLAVYGLTSRGLVGSVLCPVLVLLAAIDWRHRLLPNAIVIPATIVMAAIVAATERGKLLEHLLAAVAVGAVFLTAALIAPSGLGMGDVKLTVLIGVALGTQTLSALIVASIAVLTLAAGLVAIEGRSGLRRTIAFGPLLGLGAIVAF